MFLSRFQIEPLQSGAATKFDAVEKATYEGPIRSVNECIGDYALVQNERFVRYQLSIVGRSKVATLDLSGHLLTQLATVDERVIEMESGIDTGPEHFVEEVTRIVKAMCVCAVLESQTVYDNMHFGSAEVVRNQV